LTQEIAAFQPGLIVFDVFRRLFRGNVMDAQETARFLQILDELRDICGSAVVLVHHAKKGETPEIQTRALGSVNLTAWADVLIYTGGKRRLGSASVADLQIESKTAMLDQDKLRLTVDSESIPMVRVWSEQEHEMTVLRNVVQANPGLNQKQLTEASAFPDKKLRELLKRAVEKGLLREEKGSRKELLYFPAKK
jgi:RecA-family ATPase